MEDIILDFALTNFVRTLTLTLGKAPAPLGPDLGPPARKPHWVFSVDFKGPPISRPAAAAV